MEPRLVRLLPILGAALLAVMPASHAAETPPEDIRFQTETLLTGLPQPMHLEFAADGRLWFNEYGGALKVYDPKTKRVTQVAEMKVFKTQENGFLAFTLDPKFAQNGWIYLIYSPVDFAGQHLSRFQVKDDKLVAGSEKLLLKYEEQRLQCCHHGASLKFGPDGCLYFSTGDNTSPFGDSKGYAPLDQRPGKEPWDGQRTSANTNTLVGKVNRIRVNDDGTYGIPEGNLFRPGTPKTRPEIFAMGTRNPWRMSIDPKTGYVYWGEVGPDARVDGPRGSRGYDEINQAKQAGNFGYPYFVGKNFPYAEYDYETKKVGPLFDPKAPRNKSRNNTGLTELPPAVPALIYWPYVASEQWPELGVGGRTACAGPVFYWQESYEQTDGFPRHFDRSLLFWDWQRPFIKWARLDARSDLIGLEPFAPTAFVTANTAEQRKKQQALIDSGATIIRRPVDATFGPDGCLYLLDYGETWGANPDSALLKISYVRGNLPPVAKLAVSASAGPAPLKITLSAKGSRDLDGGQLGYAWRLQPGGQKLGEGEELSVSLAAAGNFDVELTVTDGQGGSSKRTLPLVVGNTPPTARFLSPQDGDFFTPGQPIVFKVAAVDAEDGASEDKPAEFAARTVVTSTFLPADGKAAANDPGLSLMRQSDCYNCHAAETPLVGPSFFRHRRQIPQPGRRGGSPQQEGPARRQRRLGPGPDARPPAAHRRRGRHHAPRRPRARERQGRSDDHPRTRRPADRAEGRQAGHPAPRSGRDRRGRRRRRTALGQGQRACPPPQARSRIRGDHRGQEHRQRRELHQARRHAQVRRTQPRRDQDHEGQRLGGRRRQRQPDRSPPRRADRTPRRHDRRRPHRRLGQVRHESGQAYAHRGAA